MNCPTERQAAGKPTQATIRLHAMQLGSEVIIAVTDDGRGIDVDSVTDQADRRGIDTEGMTEQELLGLTFQPGLSTTPFVTDVSGRGVGLDVVRTNVEAARGRVEVRSEPGAGTEFRIIVPITTAVCAACWSRPAARASPCRSIACCCPKPIEPAKVAHAEGRSRRTGRRPRHSGPGAGRNPRTECQARRPRARSSCSPTPPDGTPSRSTGWSASAMWSSRHSTRCCRICQPWPAPASSRTAPSSSSSTRPASSNGPGRRTAPPASKHLPKAHRRSRRRILVVDDALTIRELQRSILERAGFDVRVATDGIQALANLAEGPSDLVLTDIEMPNMDGFALTEAIRAHPTLANIPVLILSSRSSDADRQRGLDAGADGYIIKSGFDEASLLTAVNRLLGTNA